MRNDWPLFIAKQLELCEHIDQIDFETNFFPGDEEQPWDNLVEANWAVKKIAKYTDLPCRSKGLTSCTGREVLTVDLPRFTRKKYIDQIREKVPFPTGGAYSVYEIQQLFPLAWGTWGCWVYITSSGAPQLYYEKSWVDRVELSTITSIRHILCELNWIYDAKMSALPDLYRALTDIFGPLDQLPDKFDPRPILKEFERKVFGSKPSNPPKRTPISPKLRHQILERDGFRCCDCGVSSQELGVVLEVDHKIAVSKGGSNDPSNLRTLCKDCNIGKSNRDIDYPEGHK